MHVVLQMWKKLPGWINEGGTKSLELQMQSGVQKYSPCGMLDRANKGWKHTHQGKLFGDTCICMRTRPHDHGQSITWHTVLFECWSNMCSQPCRWWRWRRHSVALHSPLPETNQLRCRWKFEDILSIVLRIRHSLKNWILIIPHLLESNWYVSGLKSC